MRFPENNTIQPHQKSNLCVFFVSYDPMWQNMLAFHDLKIAGVLKSIITKQFGYTFSGIGIINLHTNTSGGEAPVI